MSYYDPFYPSIQATRLQIQRSFLALEQKLRLQREIDLDLQNQQRLRRTQISHLAYQDQIRHRQALLRNDNLYAGIYDRDFADRAKYAIQQDSNNLKYLSKMQILERERQYLNQQKQKSFSTSDKLYLNRFQNRSPYKGISPEGIYEQDETLIKKYEDGTRARQFKQDMINNRSRYNSANKINRYQKQGQLNRTPFHNLQYQPQQKKFSNEKLSLLNSNQPQKYKKLNYNLSNEKEKYQNKRRQDLLLNGQGKDKQFGNSKLYNNKQINPNVQRLRGQNTKQGKNQQDDYQPRFGSASYNQIQRGNQNKKYPSYNQNQPTFGFKQSNKKSQSKNKNNLFSRGRSRSQKDLNLSKSKKKGGLSPYSSYLDPKSQRSPYKSTIADKKHLTALQRSRHLGPPEVSAMEKIQKRLKLSHAIYKDSQFRNGKHETSHLFNKYDCQYRLRKQLKDKINNHPMVLKKHAMVVQ